MCNLKWHIKYALIGTIHLNNLLVKMYINLKNVQVIVVTCIMKEVRVAPGPTSGQTWPRRPDRDCYRREWGLCPPPPPS